jgi:hypothetical protein
MYISTTIEIAIAITEKIPDKLQSKIAEVFLENPNLTNL